MRNPFHFLATLLSGNPADGSLPKGESIHQAVDNTAHADGLVSADGFSVICSVGGEKHVRPNHFAEVGETEFRSLSAHDDIYFPKCGHLGPLKFEVIVWGHEKHGYELPARFISGVIKKTADPEFACPRCHFERLKAGAIRCCLCGGSILPDDGIALYDAASAGVHETATIIDGSAVGCLRMDCCPSGGFYAGSWTGEGIRPLDVQQFDINLG